MVILLQISISYSRRSTAAIIGEGAHFRQLVYAIVGITSALLFLAVFISLRYLILPLPLKIAAYLVSFAIFAFIGIPLSIAFFSMNKNLHSMDQFLDAARAAEPIAQFSKYPEDLQAQIIANVSFPDIDGEDITDDEEPQTEEKERKEE